MRAHWEEPQPSKTSNTFPSDTPPSTSPHLPIHSKQFTNWASNTQTYKPVAAILIQTITVTHKGLSVIEIAETPHLCSSQFITRGSICWFLP